MNLMYLRYFIVVAECLNYAEASKRLYIPQPTLSYSIAALEKELDVRLFIRSRQSVSLTPSGEILYSVARDIIQLVDQAYIDVKVPLNTEPCSLNIGFPGDFLLPYCFQTIISPFMTKYPRIRSNLIQNDMENLYEGLTSGRFDIIISRSFAVDDIPIAGSICKKLTEDFFCLIIAADQFDAVHNAGNLSPLENIPLLLPDSSRTTSLSRKILKICGALAFQPKIRQTTQLYDSLIPMVACGAGIAVIPESLFDAGHVNNLRRVRLRNCPAAASHIVAIWLEANENPSLHIFTDYLNKNF